MVTLVLIAQPSRFFFFFLHPTSTKAISIRREQRSTKYLFTNAKATSVTRQIFVVQVAEQSPSQRARETEKDIYTYRNNKESV